MLVHQPSKVHNGAVFFSVSNPLLFARYCFPPQPPPTQEIDGVGWKWQGIEIFLQRPLRKWGIKRWYVPNRPTAKPFFNNFLKKRKFLLQIEGNADIVLCGLMLFFYTLFNGSGRRLITLVLFDLGLCVLPKADMSLISAFSFCAPRVFAAVQTVCLPYSVR